MIDGSDAVNERSEDDGREEFGYQQEQFDLVPGHDLVCSGRRSFDSSLVNGKCKGRFKEVCYSYVEFLMLLGAGGGATITKSGKQVPRPDRIYHMLVCPSTSAILGNDSPCIGFHVGMGNGSSFCITVNGLVSTRPCAGNVSVVTSAVRE